MAQVHQTWCCVLPFCACFIEEVGLQKEIGPLLNWRDGEYDVLDSEEVYVAVARHRGECRLQPVLPWGEEADALWQRLAAIDHERRRARREAP